MLHLFAAGAPLARPGAALVLLTATVAAWHVPALYDATLGNEAVHQLEHVSFVATAILFWAAVSGRRPCVPASTARAGALYLALALVPGWILAIVLASAHTPFYAYATLAHRPGGISALADQQIAAGVMWVPGSLAYVVAACWSLYSWLEPAGTRQAQFVADH